MNSQIFICYSQISKKNKITVLELAEKLKNDGFIYQLKSGESFQPKDTHSESIISNLKCAQYYIVFWSKNYKKEYETQENNYLRQLIKTKTKDHEASPTIISIVENTKSIKFINNDLKNYPVFNFPDHYNKLLLYLVENQSQIISEQSGNQKPQSPTLRLSPIPINTTKFIGRERELATIHKHFSDNLQVLQVSGMGGIGKTILAKSYIHMFESHFDYVAWVTFEDTVKKTIIRQINPYFNFSGDDDKIFQEIILKLQNLPGEKLLIIDNLDQYAECKKLKDTLPGFKILVTSRLILEIPQVYLRALSTTECLFIFTQHCKRDVSQELLYKLFVLAGYNTLFIEMLAKTYDNSLSTNFAEFLALIQFRKYEHHDLNIKLSIEQTESDKTVFEHLVAIFDIQNLSSSMALVLTKFSILPEVVIKREELLSFFSIPDKEKTDFINTVNRLVKEGWIKKSNDGFICNAVISILIAINNPPIYSKCQQIIIYFTETILNSYEIDSFVEKQKWIPFAKSLLSAFYKEKNEVIANLRNALSMILQDSGEFVESLFQQKKAFAIYHQLYTNKPQLLVKAHCSLSRGYMMTGNLKSAVKHAEEALDLVKNQKMIEDEAAVCLMTLADVFNSCGRAEKALKCIENALEYFQNSSTNNDFKIATAFQYHATILNSNGYLIKASDYIKKSLKIFQGIVQESHPSLTASYVILGKIWRNIGRLKPALDYLNQSAKSMRNIMVSQHPVLGDAYLEISKIHFCLGEYSESLEVGIKCQLILEKVLPGNHPSIADVYSQLALTHLKLGNPDKAIHFIQNAIQVYVKTFGLSHPILGSVYRKASLIYLEIGNLKEAINHYEISKEILNKYTISDLETAKQLILSAKIKKASGNIKVAKKSAELALQLFKQTGIKKLAKIADTYLMLAALNRLQAQSDVAMQFCEDAWQLINMIYNENSVILADCLMLKGLINQDLGMFNSALDNLKQSKAIYKTQFKKKHPIFLVINNNLALLYKDNGQLVSARFLINKALENINHFSRFYSPIVSSVFNSNSLICMDLQNFEEALVYNNKALEIIKNLYGEAHLRYAEINFNLALIYSALEYHKKAENHVSIALKIQENADDCSNTALAVFQNGFGVIKYRQGEKEASLKSLTAAKSLFLENYSMNHIAVQRIEKNMVSVSDKL